MDYYIGSINGSGIEADNFDDFVEYLRDMAKQAEKEGDKHFDVFVENYLTGDDDDEEYDAHDIIDYIEKSVEVYNSKLDIYVHADSPGQLKTCQIDRKTAEAINAKAKDSDREWASFISEDNFRVCNYEHFMELLETADSELEDWESCKDFGIPLF